MKMKLESNWRQAVFGLTSLILISLGFYSNSWGTVPESSFQSFQRGNESLVLGRLSMADREGLFKKGALTGRYKNTISDQSSPEFQYDLYTDPSIPTPGFFGTYASQPGGQAILFAVIGKVIGMDNGAKLKTFRLFTSLMNGLFLALILLWIRRSFGWIPALVVLLLILMSYWLTLYGRNLWWVLANFYLPFMVLFYVLNREKKSGHRSWWYFFFLAGITVLIKFLFTGFEYITTALIMFCIPLLYYKLIDSWSIKKLLQRLIAIGAGSIAGLLLGTVILVYQISRVQGSISAGISHLKKSFAKRTSGGEMENFNDQIQESLDASYLDVLADYWKSMAIDLSQWWMIDLSGTGEIEHSELIAIFLIFSILVLWLNKKMTNPKRKTKNKALIICLWVSLSAPLSWFILFKAHSYIHIHMNPIVFYMPFVLIGYTAVGLGIQGIIHRLRFWVKSLSKKAKRSVVYISILLVAFGLYSIVKPQQERLALYKNIAQPKNLLENLKKAGISIYQYDGSLWVVNTQAGPIHRESRYIIHCYPVDSTALEAREKPNGFRNLDFTRSPSSALVLPWWSDKHSYLIDGVKLPDFEIQSLRVGQRSTRKKRVWMRVIPINDKQQKAN